MYFYPLKYRLISTYILKEKSTTNDQRFDIDDMESLKRCVTFLSLIFL